ncbi:MAG: MFS transporter [Luteolibacter sp.]
MFAPIRGEGPFASRNPRLFVWFTVLYNARAYYPVLAVFFTDLGLTLEQFVLLNAVWAATIVLLEVPSGALADTLGRKRLLVFAAGLMVVEMGLLLVAPKDAGWWLFGICLLNRVLSGASEAAASGADEAIAYDALPEQGRREAWDVVLATAMRWRAAGFLIAMSAGGLLYDPSWVNRMLPDAAHIPMAVARRLPVALVSLQALGCLAIALRFEEAGREPSSRASFGERCQSAARLTWRTVAMAVSTRSVALVVAGGLIIDCVARNFATINSGYYRMIGIPDWAFGLLGSLVAVGNWFVPGIAARMNQRLSPTGVLTAGGVITMAALFLLPPAWPWGGLVPAMVLMMMLGIVGFTVSRHLHHVAESSQRATLLSVKGLIFNLGYGGGSLVFSGLLYSVKAEGDLAFQQALLWQAVIFAGVFGGFILVCRCRALKKDA